MRRTRAQTRGLVLAASLVLALTLIAPAASAAPPARQTYTVTSLGTPLTDVLVLGGVTAPAPDGGRDVLWVATGGKPSHLQAIDPLTGAVLAHHALVHEADDGYAEGGYGVTAAPNGDVYVGTYYDGRLYRRKAGPNSQLEDLGQMAGQSYLYRLTFHDDGLLYGGTYPGGKLFSYDPATGAVRDVGQLIPGEMYVRSVASGDGVVYAGTYNCHILAVEPVSGTKTELPQPAPNCGHVSDMNYIDGILYARTGNSIINAPVWAYNPATNTWRATPIPNVAGLDQLRGPDGKIYFMHTDGLVGTLMRFDPVAGTSEQLPPQVSGRVVNNRGAGWIDLADPAWPGLTLVQMLWRGAVMLYNPATGHWSVEQSDITGEPIGINVVAAGAHDVYAGGYLNGGLAIYDPTADHTTFHRFAQLESILEDGTGVWLGSYPDARKYLFDRAQVWSNAAYSPGPVGAEENPILLDDGKPRDQVRTPAVADLGDRVAFGTQPGTTLTGSIVVIDKATHAATHHAGPIADQSTVSLVARDGVLYAGTSILGSYAQPPATTTDPSVYSFDPARGALMWRIGVKPGMSAVRGLEVDGRGNVWVLQNGTITTHNARNGDLKRTIRLTNDTSAGNWQGQLAYDPVRNVMWALVQGSRLYRIDAQRGWVQLVYEHSPIGKMDVQPSTGDVYLSQDAELLVVRAR